MRREAITAERYNNIILMTNEQLQKRIKWFSIFEIVVAIILIFIEVIDYFTLISLYEADNGFIVDYAKYKENVYSPLFMWIVVLVSGIQLIQLKKVGWTLNVSLLIMLYLCLTFPFIYMFYPTNFMLCSIGFVILTVLLILLLKLLFKKQLLEYFGIEKSDKLFGLFIGVGLFIIYWIIKITT